MKDCLLIVDLQNDFCPGGALQTRDGHKIIPVINELMHQFSIILASKDWHPANTVHFDNWPVHCVRATSGAAFPDALNILPIQKLFLKGTGNNDDGYSAFESTNEDLSFYLKQQQIDHIYLCGIATEYCVKATAMDAIHSGFKVTLITDAISAVELKDGDTQRAIDFLQSSGVILMTSSEIISENLIKSV